MSHFPTLWTSKEAAAATNGQASGDWQADAVCIDSRAAGPGSLFVAIIGERVDGHAFATQALDQGAAAIMVSTPVDGVPLAKQLLVADTHSALEDLGKAARARSQGRIIGLTGSVGKTTAKEALRRLCAAFGSVYATPGNLNNHYGTPLSLANLPRDVDFGIFEMGMNHAGEIAALTAQVRPHVALITTVEAVHLEFFDNEQGIARAKAEIFEGLEPGGMAILNADNRHTPHILQQLAGLPAYAQLSFGEAYGADVQLLGEAAAASGVELRLEVSGQEQRITVPQGGVAIHTAMLAAMTVAKALGLDEAAAATALSGFDGVAGRGQLEQATLAGHEVWLIDDSYNASPVAMRAAFALLADVKLRYHIGGNALRSVAVLGDMLELGEQSAAMHAALADDLVACGADVVCCVGELMHHLHDALPSDMSKHHTSDIKAAQLYLKDQLQAGDVVLFKGSHGSHIHQLVSALQS